MNLRTIRRGVIALALLSPSLALAQGVPVFQSGTVIPHHLLKSSGNGLQRDAGGLTGDVNGRGVSPFAITDSLGLGLCSNTAVTGGEHYAFCLGHDSDGNALLSVTANGGAADKALKLSINGTEYDLPSSGAGSGNVTGPLSSTVGNLAFFNATNGQVLSDRSWADDGTRLTAPSGRTITLSNAGAYQLGGTGGPYMTAVLGISDTVTIIAQPGAGPSGDTTNLEVFPPDTGDKAYLAVSRSLPVGSEERLIFGHEGGSSDYTIGQVVSGGGASCHNINFLDGVSAVPGFTIVCGTAGAPPNPQIGTGATLMAGTAASGSQELLNVDGTLALQVGEGAAITSIIFNKHISSLGTSPSLSSCGTTPSIVSATDTKGFITIGTGGPTSCTVTFATAYAAAPVVQLTGLGSGGTIWSAATVAASNFVISGNGADLSGLTVMYMVMQ